jgi:hypothetical protein
MDNLTRNVLAAKNSGISYGKCKAMNPVTAKVKTTIDLDLKKCPICNKMFKTKNSKKVYCSSECQNNMNSQRAKLKRDERREEKAKNGRIAL